MTALRSMIRRSVVAPVGVLCAVALVVAACAHSGSSASSSVTPAGRPSPAPAPGMTPTGDISTTASPALRYPASAPVAKPDPSVGLKVGATAADAGFAAWNMRLISNTPPSNGFAQGTGSDIAFTGKYSIMGNYRGFQIYDISTPAKPVLQVGFLCPT